MSSCLCPLPRAPPLPSRRTPTAAQTTEGGAAAAAGVPTAAAGLTYGNHMAISMALGFLFLGGGARTFGTSNGAIAALLISVYPRFPAATNDHRCHLQVCCLLSLNHLLYCCC